MADELKQSQLARIVAPAITDVKYAEGMADAFDKINDNFKKIASLPFLQGVQGDSYQLEEYKIWNDDWTITEDGKVLLNSIFGRDVTKQEDGSFVYSFEEIKSNIGEELDSVSPIDFFGSGSGEPLHNTLYFYVIKDDANNVIEKQLGQFYYFIDARLKNIGKVYGDETLSVFNDYTGFYQYRYNPKSYDQKYLRIDILPSIYYDRDKNDLCWKFNGNETGISAIGIEGQSGKDADLSIVLVEANPDDYSSKVEAEFNYLKDNTSDDEIYWDDDVNKIKEGKAIICCKTKDENDDVFFNFAYGELIKGDDGVLNAYWNPGTMYSHVIDNMKITSYFYDMGTSQDASAPHYLAIPSDSNRSTGSNKNAAHVIRNNDTNSGSMGLEFVNTSDAFNATGGQKPNPKPISEIKDIKLSNYNLKIGGEQNVYISNDKVKIGSTSYIGTTGAVINGNLNVTGTGNFNGKITGATGATINGGATISGLATMKDGAVGKVNGITGVYLGCPIGTIVMWAGQTTPDGWLLCDGTGIPVYKNNGSYISKACTIQGEEVEDNDLTQLVFGVFKKSDDGSDSLYGRASYYYVSSGVNRGWVKEGEKDTDNNRFVITSFTPDVKEALKFYDPLPSNFVVGINNDIYIKVTAEQYQCINLPNLQQKFPLGAFDGTIGADPSGSKYNIKLGNTGGEDMHKLTKDEMPEHSHNIEFRMTDVGGSKRYFTSAVTSNDEFGYEDVAKIEEEGKSEFHNNIPPFLAINFIIKYK